MSESVSEALDTYRRLLAELDAMSDPDGLEADALREKMDAPWCAMTAGERELMWRLRDAETDGAG